MKQTIFLAAVALIALAFLSSTTNAQTIGKGTGKGTKTNWVDANGDGICDNHAAKGEGTGAGMGKGKMNGTGTCNGTGTGKGMGKGKMMGGGTGTGTGTGTGVCDGTGPKGKMTGRGKN